MAENLFSKFRPLTLDEVFSHDVTKKDLKSRIKDNNIPKVIMFSGKAGTGKNCLEKIVSKTIFCKHKDENGNPCNECEQCLTVINDKQSSYYYLYDGTQMGLDDSKQINDIASKKNLSSIQDKIIVIDEFQGLASAPKALSAILKVMEKKQDHIYFVLLTMNESALPKDCKIAIKRRGVIYKLQDLSFEDISRYMLTICNKMQIAIDTSDKAQTLITIAQNSEGSPGLAVSYLERCIYSELWNPKTVLDELGIISNDGLVVVINQLLSGDVKLFDSEINKDILDKIRWILNILYKSKFHVAINQYQKSYLQGIENFSIEVIGNTIDILNKITLFPYINQEIIDFTLIDILRKNKTEEKQVLKETTPEVKVRERQRVIP